MIIDRGWNYSSSVSISLCCWLLDTAARGGMFGKNSAALCPASRLWPAKKRFYFKKPLGKSADERIR